MAPNKKADLRSLHETWKTAQQDVVLARSDYVKALDEQLNMPRENPEGYERKRMEVTAKSEKLDALSASAAEWYANYVWERDERRERRENLRNLLLLIATIVICVGTALGATAAWYVILRDRPAEGAPAAHPHP